MNSAPEYNITSLLDITAFESPDRPALVFGNSTLSFSELLKQTNQCANMLRSKGLKPGDRMIIMIPMSPKLYSTLLAVIRCGAVAVFVDPWIPMKQIAYFSAFAEPTGFIGIPKSHVLRLFNRQLAKLPISISTGRVFLGIPARSSFNSIHKQDSEFAPAAVSPDDPALITFTSGSSGIPKGANRTHGFLRAQYDALCTELDYRDDDIDMPMFPVFALRNLAAGITSVIPDMDFRDAASIDAAKINAQIKSHSVSLITASPPFLDQLAALENPPSVRKLFTGGAPVTVTQLKQWETAFPSAGVDIIYGSTEAEPVAHLSSKERIETENENGFCCGIPTRLLNAKIIEIHKQAIATVELNNIILPQGETGELIVSGAHVCRSYFNNAEAEKENKIISSDGTCWHRMGDTGYFDKEGRFFLTGRVHSTINRKGTILHAQLIEAQVSKQVPSAERVAALEENETLLIVIQGSQAPHSIDADRIIFTETPLPLDPRHQSKIDYTKLHNLIEKGLL